MSMKEDAHKTAHTATVAERQPSALQSWSAEDTKMLIIAFASAIGANLITVLFVGLAIILAHYFRPVHNSAFSYGILVFETFATAMSIYLMTSLVRQSHGNRDTTFGNRVRRLADIVGIIFFGSQGLLFCLVWIGLAAGIK